MKNTTFTALALLLPLQTALAQAQISATAAVSGTAAYPHAIFVYHPATGTVVEDVNGEVQAGPASLTKLMTLYLLFDALKSGKVTLQTELPVSEKAWRTGGSKMFVQVGTKVPVEELIRGIAIVSGNDACVVVAEYLGGTEDGFVQMMNAKAKDLGMAHTHFVDSNGLPDPQQTTTAHDIAMLLSAIFTTFPEYKKYLAEEEFTYNNIHQQNRNGLLHTDLGIDAGKTGHTDSSGYHLASTAMQNGERLVVVVMGTNSFGEREGESMQAYRTYFASNATYTPFKAGEAVVENVPVWHGAQATTNLTVPENVAVYINKLDAAKLKAHVTYNQPIVAPAAADKPVGELTLTLPTGQTLTTALVPQHEIAEAGFVKKFFQTLASKF
jgi:D-alanyl-D-alanine carboxypeptidase (penicillin-binding protein 5/6)